MRPALIRTLNPDCGVRGRASPTPAARGADRSLTGRRARPLWRSRRLWVWLVACGSAATIAGLNAAHPSATPYVFGLEPKLAGLFLAALVCEFVDSSLGMGFGTTLTPVLLLAGFEPIRIVPAVLFSECLSGLAAGLLHHRDGNVDFLRDRRASGTVLLLLAFSTVGALGAVRLATAIPRYHLTLLITLIVLAAGVLILATTGQRLRYRRGQLIALGAVAAFNKGVSGGGFGPIVTAGQVVSGMPARHAVAVASLAEGFTCLVGVAGYVWMRSWPDLSLAAPLAAGALVSVPLATLMVSRLADRPLRLAVGACTCALGLAALLKLIL